MSPLLARLVAAMLSAWARFCLKTSRFSVPAQTEALLAATWDADRPVVYVYWHDEFVLNLLLPLQWRAARIRPQLPACGANDAFGGDVIVACLARLGVPLAILPRKSDRAEKLARLSEATRTHRRLLLAGDYGSRGSRRVPPRSRSPGKPGRS